MRHHPVQSTYKERKAIPSCTKGVHGQKRDTILYKVGTEIDTIYHCLQGGYRDRNEIPFCTKVGTVTVTRYHSVPSGYRNRNEIPFCTNNLHRDHLYTVTGDMDAAEIPFCTEYWQRNNLLLDRQYHFVLHNTIYVHTDVSTQC
jgi:hypothetical protein